jgi:hypothetical protein
MGAVWGPAGPLAKAQIFLLPPEAGDSATPVARTVANDLGQFRLDDTPRGRWVLRARSPGLAPASQQLVVLAGHGTQVRLTLKRLAQALAPVEVEGERSSGALTIRQEIFEARRARGEKYGFGEFWDAEDIQKTTHTRVWDLVRTLPGVRVDHPGPGVSYLTIARCPSPSPWEKNARTPTRVFINGVQIMSHPDEALATINLAGVAGIELYKGASELPDEVMDGCSAIFIWTK